MIEVSHVSRNFGTFRAVNDVSFSIPTGQIVGLLGPNGAGKTTTMRMITGFLSPSEGKILIDGIDVSENPVETKKKIGYMPESAPLYGEMIVEDYLKYVAQIHGENPEERIPQLCQECGLKEIMDKNISELSRGNRQRVALAHALMANPEILILDEPTSGLDPNQVEDVRNIIREIGKTRTVIVSTHILSEVETICSRAIIISGGKLVADSPIDELKQRFGNELAIKILVANTNFDLGFNTNPKNGRVKALSKACLDRTYSLSTAIKAIPEVQDVTLCKNQEAENAGNIEVLISVKGQSELRPQIAKVVVQNNWDLLELSVQKNTLEDVFHVLTSSENSEENKNSNVSEAVSNE